MRDRRGGRLLLAEAKVVIQGVNCLDLVNACNGPSYLLHFAIEPPAQKESQRIASLSQLTVPAEVSESKHSPTFATNQIAVNTSRPRALLMHGDGDL